jgi:hypothetical protein
MDGFFRNWVASHHFSQSRLHFLQNTGSFLDRFRQAARFARLHNGGNRQDEGFGLDLRLATARRLILDQAAFDISPLLAHFDADLVLRSDLTRIPARRRDEMPLPDPTYHSRGSRVLQSLHSEPQEAHGLLPPLSSLAFPGP